MHRRGSDPCQTTKDWAVSTATDAFAVGTYDGAMIDRRATRHAKALLLHVLVVVSAPIPCAGGNKRFGLRRLVAALKVCAAASCQAIPTVQDKSGSAANESCDKSQQSKCLTACRELRNLSRQAKCRWLANAVGGIVLVIAAVRGWHDVVVLTIMVAVVAGMARRILAVGAVLLFTVAFPPHSWPVWWFCLAPLVWIWRDRTLKQSLFQCVVEAVVIGFALGWLSTGFVRAGLPAFGWLVHVAACLVFSLQFVVIAMVIRSTRHKPVFLAAPLCALAAVGGDLFEAWCGVSWSVTNLALTVGATPLAQWSRWITPFGVSGLLYLINFTLVRENAATALRRWMGPAISVAMTAVLWCGGDLIAARVSSEPLPFSVLLVQPHLKVSRDEPWRPWLELDRITQTSLLPDGPVDLVVWPESCLSESSADAKQSEKNDIGTQFTVQQFSNSLTPIYETNCLVGVVIRERGTMERYGLKVVDVRRYNCGCLVSRYGNISRHDKLDLVPFKEGLPWLVDNGWVRCRVLPALQLNQPMTPGTTFKPLTFRDRTGSERSIAVSVCYESLLPWLPQYRRSTNIDAIVHLVYDGNTAEHPSMMQRHIRACQFRAIETRKWNLVCSTWAGSVIIDPAGTIVAQLPATAGVLRSDAVDSQGD